MKFFKSAFFVFLSVLIVALTAVPCFAENESCDPDYDSYYYSIPDSNSTGTSSTPLDTDFATWLSDKSFSSYEVRLISDPQSEDGTDTDELIGYFIPGYSFLYRANVGSSSVTNLFGLNYNYSGSDFGYRLLCNSAKLLIYNPDAVYVQIRGCLNYFDGYDSGYIAGENSQSSTIAGLTTQLSDLQTDYNELSDEYITSLNDNTSLRLLNTASYNSGYADGIAESFSGESSGNAIEGMFNGIYSSIQQAYNTLSTNVTLSGITLGTVVTSLIAICLVIFVFKRVMK